MAWYIATSFFIGKISKGRTIKNVVIGGYGWGLAGKIRAFWAVLFIMLPIALIYADNSIGSLQSV